MTRSDARELAVHLIYSQTFTLQPSEQLIADRLQEEYYKLLGQENDVYKDRPDKRQVAYMHRVVAGVCDEVEKLNAEISKYSIGWDVSRISRLARSVMQLAIYEILYVEDVPTGVAVSEAVRIAKKYYGADTGSVFNGILGSFARSLTAEEVK
ncbi:MAG: transcription antitermination factor NusB [Oscillospiraceae bacterium]|nr:transcription antitermination factor NusB [Oscillospiraceae bacterium]